MRSTIVFGASIPILLVALVPGCGSEPSNPGGSDPGDDVVTVQSALTNADRAFHWAPIHYQDVNETGGASAGGYADLISRFDDDGDWTASNNWDLLNTDNQAYAYYAVAETSTHWFISYAFFHPRDWDDDVLHQKHENDMENMVKMIRKDKST